MPKALTEKVINLLKTDEELVFKIAQSLRKKFRTVENWIRDENDMLTADAVVNIIKEHTNLSEAEIIIEEPSKSTV